jgi:phosphomethylpyrimidine synthase
MDIIQPQPSPKIKIAVNPSKDRPLVESFPNSEKVFTEIEHNDFTLRIPQRRIHLTGDNGHLDIYDTTGPQGTEPREGLPKLRKE